MSIAYIHYELQNGYIHNWLVAGPQAIEVKDLERFSGADYKLQIARHYHEVDSGITEMPVERGALTEGTFTIGDYEGAWSYTRCREDHFVDLSAFYHTCHYLRAWAYAQIENTTDQESILTLTTNGPADVWLNGIHIHRQEHFHHQDPRNLSFPAHLSEGRNEILIRFEEVAARECPYVMALRIEKPVTDDQRPTVRMTESPEMSVVLPTTIEDIERRNTLEQVFEAAYLEQDVYARDDEIVVKWPAKDDPEHPLDVSASIALRLQTVQGHIYAEGRRTGAAGNYAKLGATYQFPESQYHLILMPQAQEYYEGNMRITRKLDLWGLGSNRHFDTPYSTYPERRREALLAAARRESNIFSEIAKMAIGWWSRLKMDTFTDTIAGINQRKDCSDFYMAGLLGMIYRFSDNPGFPADLKQPIEDCILNFKYWHDEPGSDAMCYTTENHSILFHTCEILAGQRYPDHIFTNTGQTGQWHREKGEQLALAWMRERGSRGFSEWDSNCYFEEDLLALSHLADLAETDAVWEMASVLIDKLLFTIAVNSYKGVFGSTHGRTYSPLIKGGYLEGTSGITHLLWGMGVFNARIMGTVSMACLENYQLPRLLQDIASDLPEEMWNREHHAPRTFTSSPNVQHEGVNKVTYKTADYMLCSAQDYHPGEKGYQQHIWQATLGPGATVFVTHPPCASEEGSHRPNFWHGNYILPRVAQWKDVLIAVHMLPEDDWMGFTHAYFPIHAFDTYAIETNAAGVSWAFAQKSDGYLALTATQGLQLITTGDTAYRELRSHGQHNVWVCQMGRATLDGNFETFQEKVLALDITFDVPSRSARIATLRGETLSFGWEGSFLRDGEEIPLSGFRHYENPYCITDFPAEQMDIGYRDLVMRLKFG
ncbi:MAG: hypothetical protein JXA33_07910 [Anaerolineae bacterium]|nr:hypothetical protein [Anaerolineae bacterium]